MTIVRVNARDGRAAAGVRVNEDTFSIQTGGQIHGGPVTFLVEGKQHVAVAAGNGLFVFVL